MKKIIILMSLFTSNIFALALGDTVNSSTAKVETTTNSKMEFSATKSNHTEYTIHKANGTATVLVNNNQKVYGFTWSDKNPNIRSMLGTNNNYQSEFNTAYTNRQRGDHRRLIINTEHLKVYQFGLPGGPFSGSMIAKDLAPSN